MSSAVVDVGDKLHVMTRRFFEEDIRRHFVGEVVAVSPSLVEVRGYTFIFQPGTNEYRRLPEERSRLFNPGESGHVVTRLPRDTDVAAISYQTVDDRLVVTDGRSLSMPINEFGSVR